MIHGREDSPVERPPRLHHIGFVAADGERTRRVMADLGLEVIGPGQPDPVQRVEATFVDLTGDRSVFLEILEPIDDDSPISRLAAQGGGLHHICLEVDDIRAACRDLETRGFRKITGPVDCLGFDRTFPPAREGRTRIAFWLPPIRLLVELVQRP